MSMTKAKQIQLATITGLTNTGWSVQSWIEAVVASSVRAIAADSQNYLSIVNGNELHVKGLLIVSVTTDNTYSDLAARIAGTWYDGTQMQMWDTLILAAATWGTQIYINNGLNGGTAADFTLIRNPDVTPAYIRSQISAWFGLSYNSTTGVMSADVSVGALDADAIKITWAVAWQASGDSVQSALEALDAKQVIGTRDVWSVACPVSVANTNFNVTVPNTPIATQSQVYSINGIRELAVSVSGTTVTFNVPYAVDATDSVKYEYFY